MLDRIHHHLDQTLRGQAACVKSDCPVGPAGINALREKLAAGPTSDGWEETLAAAQTAALCDDACPACDGLVAVLNDLSEVVAPTI